MTTNSISGTSEILQYDTYGSFNITLEGAVTTNQIISIEFTKVGRSVTLYFNGLNNVAASHASALTSLVTTPIPTDLIPKNDTSIIINGLNNSTLTTLLCTVFNDGGIRIGPNTLSMNSSGFFTPSGNCGFMNFHMPYISQYGLVVPS